MIERVVVPVNFTDERERALLVAPELANWAGKHIELVSVVAPVNRPDVEPTLARLAEAHGEEATWRIVESGGPPEPVLVPELHRRPLARLRPPLSLLRSASTSFQLAHRAGSRS